MSLLNVEDSQGNAPVYQFDVNNRRDIFAHYLGGAEVFALMSDGFIRTPTGWKYRTITLGLGDLAADSDAFTYPLLRAKSDITIIACSIGVDTTVGADATNYQTFYLENSGNTTDISSLAVAGAYTLHVPQDFSSLDDTAKVIKAGSTCSLRLAKTLTGKALSGFTVNLTYSVDQAFNTVGDADDNMFRIINDVDTTPVIYADNLSRPPLVLKEKGIEGFRIDINGKMTGTAPDQYYYHVVNVGDIIDADGGAKVSVLFKPHATVEVVGVYFGNNTTMAVDDNSNYSEILLKDDSGNIICSGYLNGPYGGGQATVKGLLYDMGDVNKEFAVLTSSEDARLEYISTGTAPTILGLTAVIVFKKVY